MTRKTQAPAAEDLLLLPSEVGALFRVNPKTVTRWVKDRKIGSVKTLGGHHRFYETEVRALLEANYTGERRKQQLQALDTLIAAKRIVSTASSVATR